MTPSLTLTVKDGPDFSISTTAEAELLKAEALGAAKSLTDESPDADIRNTIAQCKALTSGVEKTRKELTAPLLRAQELLMTRKREFCAALETAIARLDGILNERARRVREAEDRRRREAEAIRLKAEKEAEDCRQRAAEAFRKAEELRTKAARDKAAQEAKAAQEKASQAQATADRAQAVLSTPAVKQEGYRTETVVTVTDVHALYRAVPHLVTLTPNIAEIKHWRAILKGRGESGEIPGVTVTEEQRANVRASSL